MRTRWTIRVYVTRTYWFTWTAASEPEARSKIKTLAATGFNTTSNRAGKISFYPATAIRRIDILPPTKNVQAANSVEEPA